METLLFGKDGHSDWSIRVLGSNTSPIEWAARELRQYLMTISGFTLPIINGIQGGNMICLGLRQDFPDIFLPHLLPPATGYDGYAISVIPSAEPDASRILIAGENERGVVYAVYDLLERLGCRWFYPNLDPDDPEVVPRLAKVELPAGQWAIASPVRYRLLNASAMIYQVDPEMAKRQTDVAMKQRYNGMAWQCETKTDLKEQYNGIVSSGLMEEIKKRGMYFQGPLHCFHYFLKAEDHFDAHPEWFGLRDGVRQPHIFGGAQFCWSNSDAREVFTNNVSAFIKDCPDIDILCMCALDGGKACECPECARRKPSDNLLLVFNELADRLAQIAPHVSLETYGGYPPVQEPPETVPMHPRLRLLWAHWGRHHGMGYDDPRYDYKPNLDAWRAVSRGHGMTLCQYYADHFAEPWVAAPYAIAAQGDRRYILQQGVDSIYMLQFPSGYWWNCGLNVYMGAIILYNTALDSFDVVRDYAQSYFGGEAGELMTHYFEEWARNVELAYQVRGGSTDASRAQLARQRSDYIEPAIAAAHRISDDASRKIALHRLGKIEKLHALAERFMEAHRLLQEMDQTGEANAPSSALDLAEKAEQHYADLERYAVQLAALNQGLVDPQLLQFYMPRLQKQITQRADALRAGKTVVAPLPGENDGGENPNTISDEAF